MQKLIIYSYLLESYKIFYKSQDILVEIGSVRMKGKKEYKVY